MEIDQKIEDSGQRKYINVIVLTTVGVTIWLIFIITGIYSFFNRSPKLMLPMDEDGNTCGYGTLKEYDKLYFYKISEQNVLGNRVCVSSCPKTFTGYMNSFPVKQNLKGELEKKYFYASKQCNPFLLIIFFSISILCL